MTGFFPSKPTLSTEPSPTLEEDSLGPKHHVRPLRKPLPPSVSAVSTPSSPNRQKLSRPEKPHKIERYLCFDLENRPLAYWYDGETTSEITAFGWKFSDQDFVGSMLLCNDGYFECEDKTRIPGEMAYHVFSTILQSADIVYGHNIRRHDLPILNAGLLRRSLPTLPSLRTTDTCKDIPRRGGLSASLENLASMYGLEGEKLKMTQPMWEAANRLSPDGIELARERVVADVLLQEKLRLHLKDLKILKAPRMWNP